MPNKKAVLKNIEITIEPAGKRIIVPAGSNLLTVLRRSGIDLVATCGGNGTCCGCKIIAISGRFSDINPTERINLSEDELAKGSRLACQASAVSNCVVQIPLLSLSAPQRMQVEGNDYSVKLDPAVRSIPVTLVKPTVHELRADVERLKNTLGKKVNGELIIPLATLKDLSNQLRAEKWHGKIALDEYRHPYKVIGCYSTGTHLLGFAMDIGTTKLAGYLVDLETGDLLARHGDMNPQIAYGEDVISRIAFAESAKDGRKILQKRLIEKINEMVHFLCRQTKQKSTDIVSVVLVGNTVMHHLVCGLPVKQLGESPFIPAVSEELNLTAEELGLEVAPAAEVYFPPNIAGYVGADHLSMQIATRSWKSRHNIIAMDIGTNTEVSLTSSGRTFCCSCASGPAFEGARIQFGMRAVKGAIEHIIIDDTIQFSTVGHVPAIGICGSGILDAVSEMKKTGIIDQRGIFQKDGMGVRGTGAGAEMVLEPKGKNGLDKDIVVTRRDIQEIQLAKAAIQAGWQILLKKAGLSFDSIDEFIIAGAFGSYLDIRSAVNIGMFPDIPLMKFKQVGNAAGTGARMMLLSRAKRDEARKCREKMEYVELTIHPGFSETFFQAMYL